MFRNYDVTFRPQFAATKMVRPGADVPPCPPSYATGQGGIQRAKLQKFKCC